MKPIYAKEIFVAYYSVDNKNVLGEFVAEEENIHLPKKIIAEQLDRGKFLLRGKLRSKNFRLELGTIPICGNYAGFLPSIGLVFVDIYPYKFITLRFCPELRFCYYVNWLHEKI
jgi:hypothetical protein